MRAPLPGIDSIQQGGPEVCKQSVPTPRPDYILPHVYMLPHTPFKLLYSILDLTFNITTSHLTSYASCITKILSYLFLIASNLSHISPYLNHCTSHLAHIYHLAPQSFTSRLQSIDIFLFLTYLSSPSFPILHYTHY